MTFFQEDQLRDRYMNIGGAVGFVCGYPAGIYILYLLIQLILNHHPGIFIVSMGTYFTGALFVTIPFVFLGLWIGLEIAKMEIKRANKK